MLRTKRNVSSLVDFEHGLVDRAIFSDADLYAREQETLFARAWQFVGHDSQLPRSGSYFTSYMGESPVIVCRDEAAKVHVFLNSCRHRGSRVCLYDEGSTTTFTCPYHAWSYSTTGALVGVPFAREAYGDKLDAKAWGLIEAAQTATYKGSIWATWDPQAPTLERYLGGARMLLDTLLDGSDGEEGAAVVLCGIQKWRIPANWKFCAENFLGDPGHGPVSHRSVELVGIGPSGAGRRDDERTGGRDLLVSFPQGHGGHPILRASDFQAGALFKSSPTANAYFRECEEKRRARLGDKAHWTGTVTTLFPNVSLLLRQPRSIAVWHPCAANLTEAWRWYFVDRDAPDEVKQLLLEYYIRYSGPGGMTEQDDMENWQTATTGCQGPVAARFPLNYQMALGKEFDDAAVPGAKVVERVNKNAFPFSEHPQRNFYRKWSEFVSGQDWSTLVPEVSGEARGAAGQ